MSSWWGASVLTLGEWFIKKMPFVSYIYAASKQISGAISPGKLYSRFDIWLQLNSKFCLTQKQNENRLNLQIRALMLSKKSRS